MTCRLCGGDTRAFRKIRDREYVVCTACEAVQQLPACFVSPKAEKARYLTHNNDVEDPGYQEFVRPITSAILTDFSAEHEGLDYGCGTGPVATSELQKRGFSVKLYDPFFYPEKNVLEKTYDYIICCEVMEHFFEPRKEFEELAARLNPGGKLYCKTSIYSEEINFDKWYYKDDPTHVFFYTHKSLEWISDHLGFQKVQVEPKVIIFSK